MWESLTASTPLPLLGPHLPVFLASLAACCVLQASTHIFGPSVVGEEKWRGFPKRTKRSFATRIVSTAHALTIVPLALYNLYEGKLADDPLHGYDYFLCQCVAISAGYFFWDTIDCVINDTVGFIIHGVACMAVSLFAFRPFVGGYGPSYLIWELSTPFLNFHWFMEKLGVSTTHPKLFFVNSLMFALTFFGARICFGGYISVKFFKSFYEERHRTPVIATAVYYASNIALMILNWFWFSKIIRKLIAPSGPAAKVNQSRVKEL